MPQIQLLIRSCVSCLMILSAAVTLAQNVAPLKLQFMDADDKPIVGVDLKLGSFVYSDNSGLSLAMGDLKTVDGKPLNVDSEGKVTVAIPDAGLGDLARFRLNAKHPGFAEFNEWVNVEVNKINKITMPRGVRIAVTAVDADSGKSLVDNLYAIAEQKDLQQMVDWKSNGKGLLLSRPLRDTEKRIRLVEILDGKATRFSEPIDVPAEDGGRTVVSDIPMKQAFQFSGQLHRDVPRPVHNGMISVSVTWPTEKELQVTGPVGHWLAHAPVAEDGTFRVTGLPSGDWIQVIASSDGWISESAKAEMRQQVCPSENKWLNIEESILPNVFEFESSLTDVVIGMIPTVSASIRFVDEMDRPLVAAQFRAQRQQRFFHSSWSSREFRSQRSTADELIATRNGKTYEPMPTTSIEGKTNELGIANVVSIPGPTFEVQLEGMLFDGGRILATIDSKTLNDKPIKANRKKK